MRFRALINLVIYIVILLVFPPDRSVLVVLLGFAAGGSFLVGRELARAIPSTVTIVGGVLSLIGIAVLFAGGIITREPGYSEYIVYSAFLWIGVFVPASAIFETIRMRRRSSNQGSEI
jgi:hypothetical protein